jgi:hypothetical protein
VQWREEEEEGGEVNPSGQGVHELAPQCEAKEPAAQAVQGPKPLALKVPAEQGPCFVNKASFF